MLEITTNRLLLRDFCLEDLAAWRTLRSDPRHQRFYSEEDSSPDRAATLLQLFIAQAGEDPRQKYQLAICSKQQVLMGTVGIRLETAGNFSIGCELGRQWHGTGIAREAGQAIVDYGFAQLTASRIYAETISDNLAAIRLCESLGMQLEAERQNDCFFKGRHWNTAVLGILRHEWLQTRSSV